MSLVRRVLEQAARTPDAVALVSGDGSRCSYGRLRRQVLSVRRGLLDAGLAAGDGVLFSVRPSIDSLVLALGVVAAGGVVIFADPGAGPRMFAARMRLARPRWSAAESLLYSASRLAPVRAYARRRGLLLPDLSKLDVTRHVYTGRRLPGVPRGATALSDLLTHPAEEPPWCADAQAPAAVIFTSGTTDNPRAVVHTGASLAAALDMLQAQVPLGPGDVVHTDQLMLGLPTLISGARWSMPPLGGSPQTFLDQLTRRRATHTFCVPVQLSEILDDSAGLLPTSLRYVLLGAAPAPAGLLRRAVAAAPHAQVLSVYAMTEMLPVAIVSAQQKLAHTASGAEGDLLGTALPGVAAHTAEDGELLLAGPNLCSGYLGEPPLERLPTGDLARVDEAGRLVLLGRKKDMLIRGKFNLYPGLYEPAIAALDGVSEAAYVGLAHAEHGDEHVVLAVVPSHPQVAAGLAARLERMLPTIVDHDAVPDRIVVVPRLPRSGRGRKLDRTALRELVEPAGAAR